MNRGIISILFCLSAGNLSATENMPVNISSELMSVEVKHNGENIRIQRIQDNENLIDLDYARTSRPCPPFCIQPITIAEGVETIGELEMLDYLQQASVNRSSILVIDSRETSWMSKGMIPGAINIPWKKLHSKHAAPNEIAELLQTRFDTNRYGDALWDFSNSKTLVFYCNGPWCGQSPSSVRAMLALGYPPQRIKWYRGGIQNWKSFGLTLAYPK